MVLIVILDLEARRKQCLRICAVDSVLTVRRHWSFQNVVAHFIWRTDIDVESEGAELSWGSGAESDQVFSLNDLARLARFAACVLIFAS